MDSWAAKRRPEGPMVRVMMGELRLLWMVLALKLGRKIRREG